MSDVSMVNAIKDSVSALTRLTKVVDRLSVFAADIADVALSSSTITMKVISPGDNPRDIEEDALRSVRHKIGTGYILEVIRNYEILKIRETDSRDLTESGASLWAEVTVTIEFED